MCHPTWGLTPRVLLRKSSPMVIWFITGTAFVTASSCITCACTCTHTWQFQHTNKCNRCWRIKHVKDKERNRKTIAIWTTTSNLQTLLLNLCSSTRLANSIYGLDIAHDLNTAYSPNLHLHEAQQCWEQDDTIPIEHASIVIQRKKRSTSQLLASVTFCIHITHKAHTR